MNEAKMLSWLIPQVLALRASMPLPSDGKSVALTLIQLLLVCMYPNIFNILFFSQFYYPKLR